MGCGACLDSQKTSQPVQIKMGVPLATVLSNLIQKYKEKGEEMFVISFQECESVLGFIASNNGEIGDFVVVNQQSVKVQIQKNAHENSAGNATTLASKPLNQNQKNSNKKDTHLLTQIQRSIWKSLVILPQITTPSYSLITQIPPFNHEFAQTPHKEIHLDINRTFPHQNIDRQKLSLLLQNLTICFQGIGYTQGMNFYAGFLLLCGFTAEESYHLLIGLFLNREYMIAHCFSASFSMVNTCNKILSKNIKYKIAEHLSDMAIQQQMFSFSWFLCSFLYTLNIEPCVQIWDYMIKSASQGIKGGGYAVIVNVAICIMEKLQHKLLKGEAPDEVMGVLRGEKVNQEVNDGSGIGQIIRKIKKRAQLSEAKENDKGKIKKGFVTMKDIIEEDKQLKTIFSSQERYGKYYQGIFNVQRQNATQIKIGQKVLEHKVSDQNQQIDHVGLPLQSKITEG